MTEVKTSNRSAFPRRGHLAALAVGYAFFCLYGSLVPFDFRAIPVSEAWERFTALPYLSISMERRADWVANLLVFIPLSFFACAVLNVDSNRRARAVLACLVIWIMCCVYSGMIEFSQAWFPTRTMSQNDVYAESLGAGIGCVAWLIVGQQLVDRIRRVSMASTPSNLYETLLEFYALGLIAYQLLPLDLTLSLAEIWRKVESGKIVFLPFARLDWTAFGIYSILRDVAIYIPIGALLTVWRCQKHAVRHWSFTLGVGLGFVALVELLQIFVVSRYTSTTDALLGFAGIAIGRLLVLRFREQSAISSSNPSVPLAGILRFSILLLYALCVCAVFWLPFNFTIDKEHMRASYDGLWVAPFAKLYRGSEFNAISQVLAKSIFFVPFGIMVPWAMNTRHWLVIPCTIAAASVVGLGIELGQVMLPGKFADFTDILFYASGAVVGALLWLKLLLKRFSTGVPGPKEAAGFAKRSR